MKALMLRHWSSSSRRDDDDYIGGHSHVKSAHVSPEAFCHWASDESSNDGWVRGARALCELYAGVDANRFEAILQSLATRGPGSAIAEGARWLLARWQIVL